MGDRISKESGVDVMFIEHIRNVMARVCIGNYTLVSHDWWHDNGIVLEDSKLFYITDGEIVIKTKSGETVCSAGDMVLIPAGVCHDYYMREGASAKKYWLHFGVETDGVSIFDRYDLPLRIRVEKNDRKRIKELFESILLDGNSVGSEYGRLGALYALVEYYLSAAAAEEKKSREDEVERVLGYISKHLGSQLTLSTLASVACLSPNYLVRKFRAKMGVSPLKYVSIIRMERAKLLFNRTDMSIGSVMAEIGYSDPAYFSKCFKSYTGYSPRAFKKVLGRTVR